jgi:hypothetical protein
VQIEKDYTYEVRKNVYLANSNSHYENNLGVSSAKGAGNTQIVFFESPPSVGFLSLTGDSHMVVNSITYC